MEKTFTLTASLLANRLETDKLVRQGKHPWLLHRLDQVLPQLMNLFLIHHDTLLQFFGHFLISGYTHCVIAITSCWTLIPDA